MPSGQILIKNKIRLLNRRSGDLDHRISEIQGKQFLYTLIILND
jgi:hypothetical protein